MKLRSIELYRYVPFSFANITNLKIDNFKDIVVYAGSNGCLTGDSILKLNRSGASIHCTLKHAYEAFNGLMRKRNANWNKDIPTYIRTFTGKSIQRHLVLNIVYSGVKDVYSIKLDNWRRIRCTFDHEIMTSDGFIPAKEIVEKMVMCDQYTTGIPKYSKAISIDYVGQEPTYDIVCADPHHNFVANGIVVHNSGKSSLLRACTPMPAVRSDYEQDGLKKIIFDHEKSTYTLTSDFSNSKSPHSFIKDDGPELNESGTTGVQVELVERYLGYTQQIHEIVNGEHDFAKMSPGLRKTLLMQHNPFQLGFVIDKHKKAYSAVRAYQNNLTRLYERKLALEQEFINKDLEDQLTQEQKKLTKELSLIIELNHRLSEQVRVLEHSKKYKLFDLVSVRNETLKIYKKMFLYQSVPRVNIVEYIIELRKQIAEQETIQLNLQNQHQTIIQDLNRYTQYAQDDNHKELAEDLKEKVEQRRIEIDNLSSQIILNPFDEILLDDVVKHLYTLKELLNVFIGCTDKIKTPQEVQRLKDRANYYHSLNKRYQHQLNTSYTEQQRLETLLKRAGPDPRCISTICPLLLMFIKSQESLNSEDIKNKENIRFFERKVKRYSRLIELLSINIEHLNVYVEPMNQISSLFSQYGYLRIPVRDLSFIHILRTQPFLISTKIQHHYQDSLLVYHYRQLKQQQERDIDKYTQLTTAETVDKQFINQIIQEKKIELEQLRTKAENLDTVCCKTKQQLTLVLDYQRTLEILQTFKDDLTEYEISCRIDHDLKILSMLSVTLEEKQLSLSTRLNDISTTLRKQETLKSRYDEEVVKQIELLETSKKRLSLIEKALAGIPHQYTVQFLNTIIQNMNYFSNRVFNYPLDLIPIDGNDPLTYKFPITVGDITVPDISLCSSGQREMINAAFRLSMIVQLKLTEYPLSFDEPGRTLDSAHLQQLLELLGSLVTEGLTSQLFLISHHATLAAGVSDADVIALNNLNIVLPTEYNSNVQIEYG